MRPTFVSRAVGATSTEPSIPPAPRSTSCSRGGAMPLRPHACSGKALTDPSRPQPRVINTDQARLYGSAIAGVKKAGILRHRCRHRPVQYLNNIVEPDHRAIKRRVTAKQGFRAFHAAAANDPRLRGHAHDPEGAGEVGGAVRMVGDRFSSSTSCSGWLHETAPARPDPSLSCLFLKVATHPLLCLQQAPLQQCLHVTPPISNHKHVDVISHHSVDDAVRLEEDLTVLPNSNVQQFLRGVSTLGMLG